MENTRFVFTIHFNGIEDFVSSYAYHTRHECCKECVDLIKYIKKTFPNLAAAYRSWNYKAIEVA